MIAQTRRKPPSMGHSLGHSHQESVCVRDGLLVVARLRDRRPLGDLRREPDESSSASSVRAFHVALWARRRGAPPTNSSTMVSTSRLYGRSHTRYSVVGCLLPQESSGPIPDGVLARPVSRRSRHAPAFGPCMVQRVQFLYLLRIALRQVIQFRSIRFEIIQFPFTIFH